MCNATPLPLQKKETRKKLYFALGSISAKGEWSRKNAATVILQISDHTVKRSLTADYLVKVHKATDLDEGEVVFL